MNSNVSCSCYGNVLKFVVTPSEDSCMPGIVAVKDVMHAVQNPPVTKNAMFVVCISQNKNK